VLSEVKRFDGVALLTQFCEIKDNNFNIPFLRFDDWAEVSHITGYRPHDVLNPELWHLHTERSMALLVFRV